MFPAFYPLLIVIFELGSLPLIVLATLFFFPPMVGHDCRHCAARGLDPGPSGAAPRPARVHRLYRPGS